MLKIYAEYLLGFLHDKTCSFHRLCPCLSVTMPALLLRDKNKSD